MQRLIATVLYFLATGLSELSKPCESMMWLIVVVLMELDDIGATEISFLRNGLNKSNDVEWNHFI
jgi:hypothetical protein